MVCLALNLRRMARQSHQLCSFEGYFVRAQTPAIDAPNATGARSAGVIRASATAPSPARASAFSSVLTIRSLFCSLSSPNRPIRKIRKSAGEPRSPVRPAVYVGRAFLLGAMWEAGATLALDILCQELDFTMGFWGLRDIKKLDRGILVPGTDPEGGEG